MDLRIPLLLIGVTFSSIRAVRLPKELVFESSKAEGVMEIYTASTLFTGLVNTGKAAPTDCRITFRKEYDPKAGYRMPAVIVRVSSGKHIQEYPFLLRADSLVLPLANSLDIKNHGRNRLTYSDRALNIVESDSYRIVSVRIKTDPDLAQIDEVQFQYLLPEHGFLGTVVDHRKKAAVHCTGGFHITKQEN